MLMLTPFLVAFVAVGIFTVPSVRCGNFMEDAIADAINDVVDAAVSDAVNRGEWKTDVVKKLPGLKTRISQMGLDFLINAGIRFVQSHLNWIHIPDVHGHHKNIDYDVTNIRLSRIGFHPTLTTRPDGSGLIIKAKFGYAEMTGKFDFTMMGHHSGSFDAYASDISGYLNLAIGADDAGRPTVDVSYRDCKIHLGSFELDIHGTMAHLFENEIEEEVVNYVNSQACGKLIAFVRYKLRRKLENLDVFLPIKHLLEVDLSLVQSPSFNGSVDTAHKGEMYAFGKEWLECPLPVNRISPDPDTSRMFFSWVTEYLPNCAGFALQNSGALEYTITQQNVPQSPSWLKQLLWTSNVIYREFVPQISKQYPNMTMEVIVNSTQEPRLHINQTGIRAALAADVSPYAILPNGSLAFLFTLHAEIDADFRLSSNGSRITWSVSAMKTNITPGESVVGPIKTTVIQVAVDSAVQTFVLPWLNEHGSVGVALPQYRGFSFVLPVITHDQGFLKFATDLKYIPSM